MIFKRFVLICFSFIFFFTAIQSYSQDDWYYNKPIRDIIFTGLRNIQASELEALMNPYKGRLFNDTLFAEILGKLYALEYFERVEPNITMANSEGTEANLRFAVVERPIVRRINFVGNSNIRRTELNRTITTKESDIYNQTKIRADTEAIKNLYVEKGFPNVTVTADETHSSEGVSIIFRITENEKISILRIEFLGNTKFSENTLRNQLSLKARTRLRDGAFSEAKLIEDIETVTKYYRDRGYIDARVRDVTRTTGEDNRGANLILTFFIEEGEEFRFNGIFFEGNSIFSTEQLNKLVTSKVGDIVNYSRVEMDFQRVVDLYLENGYFSNSIITNTNKDDHAKTISYTIQIVERNRSYIENVIVTGNEKTKDRVIYREIPLEPGDVFSRTKIMTALTNLYNLQYFSVVLPETSQGSEENLMDLIIHVEEQMTTTIQFGITFSGSADPDAFPISGTLEWTDRNLAGTGNELGIKVNSSVVDSSEFSVNYLHRWFLGLPLSIGFDVTANFSKRTAATRNDSRFHGDEEFAFPDGFADFNEYEANSKQPPREYLMSYNQWYLSLGISSGYRWITRPGILRLNGSVRFGIIHNSYEDILRPFDPTLREGNNRWTPRNSLSASIALDRRDIYYDPSSGYFANERLGLYGIFNRELEHYIRSDTKLQYYHTLFNIPVGKNERWHFKSVLALHTGLSLIFPQPWRNNDVRRPSNWIENANMLSVDGMFIGRGWSGEFRNKGLLLWDAWVELRFPLVKNILAFDLFFDMAGVESSPGHYFGRDDNNNRNFTIENLRFSYGGGLRFTMPQFPIRLSLAKRFLVENGNVKMQPGALFGDNDKRGLDLVISFALSY